MAGGDSSTPVAVRGLTGVKAIVAGSGRTCALVSDGSVKCWASNEFGQLDNGNSTNSNAQLTVPLNAATGRHATGLSANVNSTNAEASNSTTAQT